MYKNLINLNRIYYFFFFVCSFIILFIFICYLYQFEIILLFYPDIVIEQLNNHFERHVFLEEPVNYLIFDGYIVFKPNSIPKEIIFSLYSIYKYKKYIQKLQYMHHYYNYIMSFLNHPIHNDIVDLYKKINDAKLSVYWHYYPKFTRTNATGRIYDQMEYWYRKRTKKFWLNGLLWHFYHTFLKKKKNRKIRYLLYHNFFFKSKQFYKFRKYSFIFEKMGLVSNKKFQHIAKTLANFRYLFNSNRQNPFKNKYLRKKQIFKWRSFNAVVQKFLFANAFYFPNLVAFDHLGAIEACEQLKYFYRGTRPYKFTYLYNLMVPYNGLFLNFSPLFDLRYFFAINRKFLNSLIQKRLCPDQFYGYNYSDIILKKKVFLKRLLNYYNNVLILKRKKKMQITRFTKKHQYPLFLVYYKNLNKLNTKRQQWLLKKILFNLLHNINTTSNQVSSLINLYDFLFYGKIYKYNHIYFIFNRLKNFLPLEYFQNYNIYYNKLIDWFLQSNLKYSLDLYSRISKRNFQFIYEQDKEYFLNLNNIIFDYLININNEFNNYYFDPKLLYFLSKKFTETIYFKFFKNTIEPYRFLNYFLVPYIYKNNLKKIIINDNIIFKLLETNKILYRKLFFKNKKFRRYLVSHSKFNKKKAFMKRYYKHSANIYPYKYNLLNYGVGLGYNKNRRKSRRKININHKKTVYKGSLFYDELFLKQRRFNRKFIGFNSLDIETNRNRNINPIITYRMGDQFNYLTRATYWNRLYTRYNYRLKSYLFFKKFDKKFEFIKIYCKFKLTLFQFFKYFNIYNKLIKNYLILKNFKVYNYNIKSNYINNNINLSIKNIFIEKSILNWFILKLKINSLKIVKFIYSVIFKIIKFYIFNISFILYKFLSFFKFILNQFYFNFYKIIFQFFQEKIHVLKKKIFSLFYTNTKVIFLTESDLYKRRRYYKNQFKKYQISVDKYTQFHSGRFHLRHVKQKYRPFLKKFDLPITINAPGVNSLDLNKLSRINLFLPLFDFSILNFYPYNFSLSDLKILKNFFIKKLTQQNLTEKERLTLARILKILRKDQAWLLRIINKKYKHHILSVGQLKKKGQLTDILYLYRNGTETDKYIFKEDKIKNISDKDFYFYHNSKASFLLELKKNKFLKFWNLYKKNKFYNRYTRKFVYKIPAHLNLYDFFKSFKKYYYIRKLKKYYMHLSIVINRNFLEKKKSRSLHIFFHCCKYIKKCFDYFYFKIFLVYKKYYELFFSENDYETYFPSLVLNMNNIIVRYSFYNIYYNFRIFFACIWFNFLGFLFFKFVYSKYDIDLDEDMTDVAFFVFIFTITWLTLLFHSSDYFLKSNHVYQDSNSRIYY